MKKTKFIPLAGFVGALFLASCEKPEPIFTDPKVVTLDDNLYNYTPAAEEFSVDASKSFSVKTTNGTIVSFPSNAFTLKGQVVTGNVEVSVKEISSKADIILSDIPTMSDEGPLESWGEFLVTASKDGQELSLAAGKTFSLNITTAAPNSDIVGWQSNSISNQDSDFVIDTTVFWSQNNLNQIGNNPCDLINYYKSLLANTVVSNNPDKVSFYLNSVTQIVQSFLLEEGYTGAFNFIMESSDSLAGFEWTTENDFWLSSISTWGGTNNIYGNEKNVWNGADTTITTYQNGSIDINISACTIEINGVYLNLNPNGISVSFNELGWCNIDALISQYGASNNCTIEVKNAPNGANVKFVFPDLNGALTAKVKSDDHFEIERLPTGMTIQVVVYYMKDKKLYFGTQEITADKNMIFDVSNIKELPSLTELVEKIKDEIN